MLTIFLLQRLICNDRSCQAVYRADIPATSTPEHYSAPQNPTDNGKEKNKAPASGVAPRKENQQSPLQRSNEHGKEKTYAPSADAAVAYLRYQFGVPHHRLAMIQESSGMPLPAATQWHMVLRVFAPAYEVFKYLYTLAASSGMLLIDDTHIKINDLIKNGFRGAGPPVKNKDQSDRHKIQTTTIVCKVEERTIVLYLSGLKHAGENLADLLACRAKNSAAPLQMSDALTQNTVPKGTVIDLHCLDHGRRAFYDLEKSFPQEVEVVLDLLGKIYRFDREAKVKGLDDGERLSYHQAYSTPIWEKLYGVLTTFKATAEPNNKLVSAINYLLKRWEKFSGFLVYPGAPLSNAECERAIKRAIVHRKNSLFYKTEKGALVGDVIMSLITTCIYERVATHDYLTRLVEHSAAVEATPGDWLPWTYQASLAKLSPFSA